MVRVSEMSESVSEYETHKVVKTRVVKVNGEGDTYAVVFTYEDGTEETAGVGSKDVAEFYAKHQKGKVFPVGIQPLLPNAEKPEKLRRIK